MLKNKILPFTSHPHPPRAYERLKAKVTTHPSPVSATGGWKDRTALFPRPSCHLCSPSRKKSRLLRSRIRRADGCRERNGTIRVWSGEGEDFRRPPPKKRSAFLPRETRGRFLFPPGRNPQGSRTKTAKNEASFCEHRGRAVCADFSFFSFFFFFFFFRSGAMVVDLSPD